MITTLGTADCTITINGADFALSGDASCTVGDAVISVDVANKPTLPTPNGESGIEDESWYWIPISWKETTITTEEAAVTFENEIETLMGGFWGAVQYNFEGKEYALETKQDDSYSITATTGASAIAAIAATMALVAVI